MNDKIVMLVAAHKQAPMPADDLYLPIHVGHALNPTNLGYQRDDVGANISALNASYCELTAVYWAWKNLEADAVGLSHYRRYFGGDASGPGGLGVLSLENAHKLISSHELVLGKPRNYLVETIESHYRHGHYGEDLDVLREVLLEVSPEYIAPYDQVFSGRTLSLYNMFLLRRDLFDQYAEWLFRVLGEVALRIDNDGRSVYQQRTFGYLGERLLNVWVAHHDNIRSTKLRIVNTEGEPKVRKGIRMMARRLGGSSAREA